MGDEGSDTMVFMHTAPALAELFDGLLAECAPDVPARHVMQPGLLEDALAAGTLTDGVRARTKTALLEAAAGARLVLCTCSTVGPGAEDAARESAVPILRVDRPMAEQAVRAGRRVTVAATLSTTLGPTADLIAQAAREAGRTVEIESVVFEEARAAFVAGDSGAYERIVADGLRAAARTAEAIVLAQASMMPALARCADIEIPLLTSPRSGLEAALACYRSLPQG